MTGGAALAAGLLAGCASAQAPLPARPGSALPPAASARAARYTVGPELKPSELEPASPVSATPPAGAKEVAALPAPSPLVASAPPAGSTEPPLVDSGAPPLPPAARCASVPPLLQNGAAPPAPPHAPLGEDVTVPGDRPAYVLAGDPGDSRVIFYLPGMCGDPTAADYFRESARAHGTLITVRGDTSCGNGRFKWRDEPARIHARILAAFESVNARRGGELRLEHAILFGYSQGADRAEKVAALYPQHYRRVVLGGPPVKPSPQRLARAERVVVFGGELETTDNMRAGFDALQAAGITSRWFTLDCAYHGRYGTNAESQLGELLDWVSER